MFYDINAYKLCLIDSKETSLSVELNIGHFFYCRECFRGFMWCILLKNNNGVSDVEQMKVLVTFTCNVYIRQLVKIDYLYYTDIFFSWSCKKLNPRQLCFFFHLRIPFLPSLFEELPPPQEAPTGGNWRTSPSCLMSRELPPKPVNGWVCTISLYVEQATSPRKCLRASIHFKRLQASFSPVSQEVKHLYAKSEVWVEARCIVGPQPDAGWE